MIAVSRSERKRIAERIADQPRLDALALAYERAIEAQRADGTAMEAIRALQRAERVLVSKLALAGQRRPAWADGERWRWRLETMTGDLLPERKPARRRTT